MKILCVDDQKDFLEMLTHKVTKQFNKIPECLHSGNDAIDWLKNNTCDLVFCDYNMKNGDGLDVIKYLMTLEQKPYFILMTTEDSAEMLEEASKYPRLRYIRKHSMQKDVLEDILSSVKATHDDLVKKDSFSNVGELFNLMTHEINNPLQIISMQAFHLSNQIGMQTMDGGHSDDDNKTLDAITRNISVIADIIQNVKKMSCTEKVNYSDFKLKDIYPFVSEFLVGKYINVDLEALNQDIDVYFNQTQMKQIIYNLLNNAEDAISDLNEKWIKLTVENNEHFLTIKMIDSGKGIPEESREKIFSKSFSKKKSKEGTGCGLALIKRFMNIGDGEVSVDHSAPNTTFVLQFRHKTVI